jgi:CRP-like cAMP-binding protein
MPLHIKYPVSDPEYVKPAIIDDLKSKELFKEVNERSLKALLEHSMICRLDAHKRLYPTRGGVDYMYVIISGYVAIWLTSRLIHMGENFLAWRGPEQIIGEMRAVGDEPSEARITTCEPCRFIELRSDILTDVANVTPQIYRNVARLLMEKMHHERHRSEVIQMSTSSKKVAQTLLYLAEERCKKDLYNEMNEMRIPGVIHQDEIGAYVGVERETANRIMCGFKRKKWIAYAKSKSGCKITILERGILEKFARAPSPRRTHKK